MTVLFNNKDISNVLSYALVTENGGIVVDSASHDSVFYYIDGEDWMEFEK